MQGFEDINNLRGGARTRQGDDHVIVASQGEFGGGKSVRNSVSGDFPGSAIGLCHEPGGATANHGDALTLFREKLRVQGHKQVNGSFPSFGLAGDFLSGDAHGGVFSLKNRRHFSEIKIPRKQK